MKKLKEEASFWKLRGRWEDTEMKVQKLAGKGCSIFKLNKLV
jgi:hypothetical protein